MAVGAWRVFRTEAAPDGAQRPARRRFSDRDKLRILEAADRCTRPGEMGILLRREGIYSSHVATWRRWRMRVHPALEGGHFCLYVAIDLYSRCVVAWRLARSESAALARDFIHQAILANGVDPAGLTVHADRGVPMTSEPLSELCARLGITRSHSRPRTSNDNAFSESQFKTLKYGPAWPEGRMGYDQWRQWCPQAFHWYNHRHRHQSIAHFTPAEVYSGRHLALREVRQRALDRAWHAHPERFVRGRPAAPAVPAEVWINRPEMEPTNHVRQAAAS
jgi:putative transposase